MFGEVFDAASQKDFILLYDGDGLQAVLDRPGAIPKPRGVPGVSELFAVSKIARSTVEHFKHFNSLLSFSVR